MFANPLGHATVYDVASKSVTAVPATNFPKPADSISLSMTRPGDDSMCVDEEHRLYVLCKADGFFEVFNYSRTCESEDDPPCDVDWGWDCLQPPPSFHLDSKRQLRPLYAAAVVDETMICVTSPDDATYAFDTESRQWSQAGSWVLPVRGAAEYAPELGLCFSIHGSHRHRMCAFDLESWPPVAWRSILGIIISAMCLTTGGPRMSACCT